MIGKPGGRRSSVKKSRREHVSPLRLFRSLINRLHFYVQISSLSKDLVYSLARLRQQGLRIFCECATHQIAMVTSPPFTIGFLQFFFLPLWTNFILFKQKILDIFLSEPHYKPKCPHLTPTDPFHGRHFNMSQQGKHTDAVPRRVPVSKYSEPASAKVEPLPSAIVNAPVLSLL